MNKLLFFVLTILAAGFSCMAASPGKFVIKGTVDADTNISEVVIFATDMDKNITEKDSLKCIPVKDNKFYYEEDLDDIMKGRIKTIFTNSKSIKDYSSIEFSFVPDFTLYISIHNGYYAITNYTDFKKKVEEYCLANHPEKYSGDNKQFPSEVGNGRQTVTMRSSDEDNSSDMKEVLNADITASVKEKYVMAELRKEILQTKLDQYKQMLKYINDKITCSKNQYEISRLILQQDNVLKLMQQAIDDYDKNL